MCLCLSLCLVGSPRLLPACHTDSSQGVSPRCLCVSAPALLREWESFPSRPNLSSRPHKASAVPKLLHAGAPQAPVFTTGNNTEEPFSPSAALHRRARPRGGGGGGGLSGNRRGNMLHFTCKLSLTAPPVGPLLFLHVGPSRNPVEALLLGLDLVNNPLGSSEASVYYMCTDLLYSQRVNIVFLAHSRSCAAKLLGMSCWEY